jgi:hypothetical protein
MPPKQIKRGVGRKQGSASKRGPKLSGQIKSLASRNAFAARMLAHHGMELTTIQAFLKSHYETLAELEQMRIGKKTALQKLLEAPSAKEFSAQYPAELQKMMLKNWQLLCEIFMEAIVERDSQTIVEIGNAVEFLKTFEETGDIFRARLLDCKNVLDRKGIKWPIRKLARAIGWPMKDSANGFWGLRRIAKELHFPLKRSTHKSAK